MPTIRDKAQGLARGYRDFWNENSELGMALGFVPVVSQVLGIADAVAAYNDERASKLERGLATAGILPLGKAAKAIKGMISGNGAAGPVSRIVGPEIIKRAKEVDQSDLLTKPHYDPDFNTQVAEFADPSGKLRQSVIDVTNTGSPRTGPLRAAVDREPLFDVMDEAGDTPLLVAGKRRAQDGRLVDYPAGQGSLSWKNWQTPGESSMELGTGTRGQPMTPRDYSNVQGAYVHERGHLIQSKEIEAGNWAPRQGGTNPQEDGWIGYFWNDGELASESARLRDTWARADKEALEPWRHRRAMQKFMEQNIEAGKAPSDGIDALANPKVAQRYAEWAADDPVRKSLTEVAKAGYPNWNVKTGKVPKGGWAEWRSFEDIVGMEPRLGEKMTKIKAEGMDSVAYKGPGKNHAKAAALGEELEPIRVKFRLDPKTGGLAVDEVDGVRRAIATRNMFGKRGSKQIPVVFEPLDADAAKAFKKDPNLRNTLHPDVQTAMEDDMNFPKMFGAAYEQGY